MTCGNSDLRGKTLDIRGLIGRRLRADCAFKAGNIEQAGIEDRKSNALRPSEVDVPGEDSPGLVHEATPFVEKTMPVLIDDDAVGVHQHDRRGMSAARVDRLDVHAVPVARYGGTLLHRDAGA